MKFEFTHKSWHLIATPSKTKRVQFIKLLIASDNVTPYTCAVDIPLDWQAHTIRLKHNNEWNENTVSQL